ncbi:pentatricopeptide repeat-containing protein At4g33990 [Manihot esculenta]|uniref:Pentacotripeptide-repeat region of PRORP domain-containing protein n=1 Tax=Manihot esculenta TaxID=3983 RepID=A0A2C9WLB5_MANES|nr:pentatricopeptide repeat-containing protein At4g33990 [Manihot esculenta]OAY61053.1 hypothetical protein MANES_01G159700v8 [Manihot esculenta]
MKKPHTLRLNSKTPLYLWNLKILNSTNDGLFSETLYLYYSMQQSGVHGNGFTFPFVLKACSHINSILHGTMVHAHVLQLGFHHHVFVQTALLDMYSKCYDLQSSRKVFDKMPVRTSVSWNSIISAYCRCSLVDEATSLLHEMRVLDFRPTSTTFLSFLAICDLQQGLLIKCCAYKFGLLSSREISLTNAFMKMYVKYGQVHEARAIFDMMHEKSVISWTTVIDGYVAIGNVSEAFSLFNRMRTSVKPDFIVFMSLISGCAQERNLLFASSIHSLSLKGGFDNGDPIDSFLVKMYANCGDLVSARRVFDMTREKSVFLWTSMIRGYTHLGYPVEALELFKALLDMAIKPDEETVATVLLACADLGSLEMGEGIEKYILSNGLHSNLQVQTSLIHMLCRCGNLEKAKAVFDRISTKDLAAWSSMINGYAIHGMGQEALSLFHKMLKTELIKPDEVIYTIILLACSHSGLVEDGLKIFQSMQIDFGIEPSIEHYTCLVDLLGRAGQLELALKTINELPVKVQAEAWAPFLSACRKYGKLELGEFAARKLFDLNPGRVGNYILMSNLYAQAGKWKEAAVTRRLVDERGLVKESGWSYIEINASVHVFLAGDRSHYKSGEIYNKLEELNGKLLEAGYIPETDDAIA